MTSSEFTEACAFSMVEPFGELVANHRASMICATIANAGYGGRSDYQPSQFPIVEEARRVEKPLALVDKWRAFVALANQKAKNHGGHRKSSR